MTGELEWQQKEIRAAIDHFVIRDSKDENDRRYFVTESSTGSRYEVFAMLLNDLWYVGVIEPVKSAYTFQLKGVLADDYIAEKIFKRDIRDVHPGDLTVMTMTIAYMLERPAYIWGQRVTELRF